VELYSFDAKAGHQVDRFGSDFVLSPLMRPTDAARTVCMHLPPGGLVGEHEALSVQLFCVVSGEGWVSGDDGERRPIKTYEAACWSAGERHAAGTETGLTAIVVEGAFTVAAPSLG
jgi:hypothetical protein